jgi:hypothetical protein
MEPNIGGDTYVIRSAVGFIAVAVGSGYENMCASDKVDDDDDAA